ncbi:MAG: hypothetical protein J0I06_03380 [Planctomycetes bacterium]|nr:hypothetical protein [Planctomycetota bacterium]
MRALLALVVALAAVGCYHDKYDVNGPKREEYYLPPDEARYNLPDTATYRRKAPEKQQDTLMNRGKGGGPIGNGLGGF